LIKFCTLPDTAGAAAEVSVWASRTGVETGAATGLLITDAGAADEDPNILLKEPAIELD
jgi:hypothetical protein